MAGFVIMDCHPHIAAGNFPWLHWSLAVDGIAVVLAPSRAQPAWFSARLGHYWRAMCTRSSASGSWISSPLTSTVTLWRVPVNLNGLA